MLILRYVFWHYGKALKEVWGICANFLAFSAHIFSVKELFLSLFAPWKQIAFERQGSIFRSGAMTIVWTNVMSRFFGAAARSVLIVFGLVFMLAVAIADLIFLAFWILAPAFPALFFILGVRYLVG